MPALQGSCPLQTVWNFITDFGDTAVTLPLAALMMVFLLASGWSRTALAFALALAGCGIAIGLVKLALESCGKSILHTDITNPSGHAALSTMVYGSLAAVFGCGVSSERRWILFGGFATLVAAIAVSRVVLDNHSLAEVIVGFSIGLTALVLFYRALRADQIAMTRGHWLALAAVVLIALMHGSHLPIEDVVRSIVRLIRHRVPRCA
ncbi:MAG TPA: phosphatase PAP2 family protein [Pseudolabrys sp.]|nr:phosphatase PAP2 family protein [Pseudolabrys sp.]